MAEPRRESSLLERPVGECLGLPKGWSKDLSRAAELAALPIPGDGPIIEALVQRLSVLREARLSTVLGMPLGAFAAIFQRDEDFLVFWRHLLSVAWGTSVDTVPEEMAPSGSDVAFVPSVEGCPLGELEIALPLADSGFLALATEAGWCYWKDFEGVTESQILRTRGFSLRSLRHLGTYWDAAARFARIRRLWRISEFGDARWGSFGSFWRSLLQTAPPGTQVRAIDERGLAILERRCGLGGVQPATLGAIGDDLGITRERVRQLVDRATDRLLAAGTREPAATFLGLAKTLLWQKRGVMDAEALGKWVGEYVGWQDPGEWTGIVRLLSLFPPFMADRDERFVFLRKAPCPNCRKAVDWAVEDVQRVGAKPLSDLARDVENAVCRGCGKPWASVGRFTSRSMAAQLLLAGERHSLRILNTEVVTKQEERLRMGSVPATVIAVLREAAGAVHFSELAKLVSSRLNQPQISAFRVHSILSDSPEALLWGRGTYIHQAALTVNPVLVREVERWIVGWLGSDTTLPVLSVLRTFHEFREPCLQATIPNEYALYSLLRRSQNKLLAYPRFPQVCLAAAGSGRVSLPVLIEDWLRDQSGPVSADEIHRVFVQGGGFREFLVDNAIGVLQNVLRTGVEAFVHCDNVYVDYSKLPRLERFARKLVDNFPAVSVARLFEDRQVDCLEAGIDSPRLLYSLLQRSVPIGVGFPGYPTMARLHGDQHVAGLIATVCNYVNSLGRECSYDELLKHFVDELRYAANTVLSVASHMDILRYLKGWVVHRAVLRLDHSAVAALITLAKEEYDFSLTAGRLFASTRSLAESATLPALPPTLHWTEDLLSDLLRKSGHFLLMGASRKAFIPVSNPDAIKSFDDLLAMILLKDFGGGSDLASFQSHLATLGLIQRELTETMVSQSTKLAVLGREIVLKRNLHHAERS